MVPDCYHANRPLLLLLEGQAINRETVVTTIRTPPQPRVAKPHFRRKNGG